MRRFSATFNAAMTMIWNRLRQRLGVFAGTIISMALPAAAADCARMDHDGQSYVVCTVLAEAEPRLQLWLDAPDGSRLKNFSAVKKLLPQGQDLGFAMNAGMFHADYGPVGLYKSGETTAGSLVTAASWGNFGLLPNGVFCSGGATPFRVWETKSFAKAQPDCRLATQSGPMLVIGGELHPRFLPDSDSRYIRNGVGVSADGQTAWFAISERATTFHEFGRFFRDGLGVQDALYFDGSVSRLYAPSVRRADFGRAIGPIIGLTEEN